MMLSEDLVLTPQVFATALIVELVAVGAVAIALVYGVIRVWDWLLTRWGR